MPDDSLGSDMCCPHCGNIQGSYEVYIEGGGPANEGASSCLYCGEEVLDDQWITD